MSVPDTCREAVLQVLAALERRHDRQVFGLEEIADEVIGTWTRWERSTVITHVSSHMCRDAPVHHWPDLERVDRGRCRRIRIADDLTSSPSELQDLVAANPGVVETGHRFESERGQ